VDFGQGFLGTERKELEESQDSFTGVNLVFILDSGAPNRLTVVWGDSKGIPKGMQLPAKATQHPIVHFSAGRITAMNNDENGVWVYSLFPALGFGVFTRQSHWGSQRYHATGSVLYAMCQFAYTEAKGR
jgi:hypothetical protein